MLNQHALEEIAEIHNLLGDIQKEYEEGIKAILIKNSSKLFKNPHTVPKLKKIQINRGLGLAAQNTNLLKKINLCTDSKIWGVMAYHLFLQPCKTITSQDARIFTLDKEQKDSGVLFIAICEGDSPIEKVPGTTLGVFLVLKKENNQYKLTDTGFGKLVAFDVDKNNRIQPIIYGESKNFNYPDYVIENDLPYYLEIRMAWDGEHLQANEVISAEFPKRNILETNGVEQVLSINEMKNLKLYDPLRQSYINQADDILKGVKIHWRFRSWSLKYKKEPNAIEQHKKKWTKGFKIE